jgi:formate dehydrogenase gamma subunit
MSEQRRYLRFPVSYRIEHWVLTVSFFMLALTGLIQMNIDAAVPRWIIGALGGIETVRVIHHLSAVVLMFEAIYHLGVLGYRIFVLRLRPTMLPGKVDIVNALQALRYNVGLSKTRALEGRYSFAEKAEYWAVVWGTVVMGLTGFILWNPIASTLILPGDFVPAAKMAHGLEALLAVLAILLWHLYHVHLRTFNKSMFDGTLSAEEMEDEHPRELKRIRAGRVDEPPAPQDQARRRRVYFPAFAVLAAVMLVGVWFFVGYEETAIATLPAAEQVAVFMPLTPTPLPTARPANTPAPTSAAAAHEGAVSAGLSWETDIAPLMKAKCTACHNGQKLGGLDLTTYEAALQGGISGAGVAPGEPHTSLIITRQASGNHPGQFTAEELAMVQVWIEAGAPEQPVAGEPQPTSAGVEPGGATAPTVTPGVAGNLTWEADIAPLMKTRCETCHSAANAMGGLDLSSYATALNGGSGGAGIVPGDPEAGQVITRQAQGGHMGQFTPEELDLLVQWVTAGAPEK